MSEWVIHEAGPSDEDAVRQVCLASGENDYVLQTLGAFLESDGVLLALVDEDPVGMVKTEVAMDGSSWLSGLRVVPRWRRRGLAVDLCLECERAAAARGSGAIRLWTERENAPSNALFTSLAYRRVGAFTRWWRAVETRRADPPGRALGTEGLLDRVWRSGIHRASNGYAPFDLRFCLLDERLLADVHDRGWLYLDNGGAPCALDSGPWKSFHRSVLELTVLGDDVSAQVEAATGLGRERGLTQIGTFLPDGEPWSDLALRAGLRGGTWGNHAVLYEKDIHLEAE